VKRQCRNILDITLRLFFIVASIGVMSSATIPGENHQLQGKWTRIGDEWAGMAIAIEDFENGYEGRLIHVPEKASEWGFVVGDVKWKINKTALTDKDKVLFEDMYLRSYSRYITYRESQMLIISEDTIQTRLKNYRGEYIGKSQTWVRQPSI